MLDYTKYVDNKGIIGIIRRTCNHIDSRLMDHGYRVAWLVSRMLREMGSYDLKQMRDICFLTMLHDIGAYKTEEIDQFMRFETKESFDHSAYGSLFIKYFFPYQELADVVLMHHTPCRQIHNMEEISEENKKIAQMIHIADRTDIYMGLEKHDWNQYTAVLERLRDKSFSSEMVDLILKIKFQGSFEENILKDEEFLHIMCEIPFTGDEIMGFLKLIIFLIDFRSRHTVTHTITTTLISYELARYIDLSDEECSEIVCGAMLHDLGKIGIPTEILEYPGKLNENDMEIMRTHVEITEEILGSEMKEKIKRIALNHHEKLDGSGYPKGITKDELTVGERIVAVADIVSALAGTRSYKNSFPKEKIVGILRDMSSKDLLDAKIVELVIIKMDAILENTQTWCKPVIRAYESIQKEYDEIKDHYKNTEKRCLRC